MKPLPRIQCGHHKASYIGHTRWQWCSSCGSICDEAGIMWFTPSCIAVDKPEERLAKDWQRTKQPPYILCGFPNGFSGQVCPNLADYHKEAGEHPFLYACRKHVPREKNE